MERSNKKKEEKIMLNSCLLMLWYFLFPEIVFNKFLKICKDPNSTIYQLLSFFDVENIEQYTDFKENGLPDFYLTHKEWPCDVALEIKDIFLSGSIAIFKECQSIYEDLKISDFFNIKIVIENPCFEVDLLGKNFFERLKKCFKNELEKYKQKINTEDINWDNLIEKIVQECEEKCKQKMKKKKEPLTKIYLDYTVEIDVNTNKKIYKINVIPLWNSVEEEWSDIEPKLSHQIFQANKKFETLKEKLSNNRKLIAVKDIRNILCVYIHSGSIYPFLKKYFNNLQTIGTIKNFLVIPNGLHYICFLEF